MKKNHLLAPGPTPMPPRVLQAMTRPILHHRTSEFKALMRTITDDLKMVFQTSTEVLVLNSSGTGAMEAAVSNFLSRGDKAIVISAGKFGGRWAEICDAYGVDVVRIDVEWGQAVKPQDVAAALTEHPEARAVFATGSETSTGVAHPIEELAMLTKDRNDTLLVVDGVTSVGVFPQKMDEWGIDILVSGSQKALMLPPGLAFLAVSEKAWAFAETSNLPKYYFDMRKERKNQAKGQHAYTSSVSLIMGLREALNIMKEEGLEAIHARHARLAAATRAGLTALGCTLLAPDSPSNAVTAVFMPDGLSADDVKHHFSQQLNITAAGGQEHLKGKIIRIAHLGYATEFDVTTAISAFELAFAKLGHEFDRGAGMRATLNVLAGGN